MENVILSQMTVASAIREKSKKGSSLSKTFKSILFVLTFSLFSNFVIGQTTYYSYQTGAWNDVNTWTTDPSGTTRVGAAVPSNNSTVVILSDRTVTATANIASTNLSIQIDNGGVLDMSTYVFTNSLRSLSGQGVFSLASASFPNVTTNNLINVGGGTVEYTTASDFSLPVALTTYNNLSINTVGSTAIQTHNITLSGDLIVKSGVFQINDNSSTTPLELVVNGNINVESRGSIRVGRGVTYTDIESVGTGGTAPFTNYYAGFHRVVLYGNFTNNGSVRFTNQDYPVYNSFPSTTQNENSGAASVFFMGATNNLVTLNGQTDFYNFIVNKGSDQTYTLTVYSSAYSNFRLFGANSLASEGTTGTSNQRKALWIRTGTLILDGMLIIPSLTEGTTQNSEFVIPSTASLQINGADVAVFVTADSYREVVLAYGLTSPYANTNTRLGVNQNRRSGLNVFGTLTVNNGILSTKESSGIFANNNTGQIIINDGTVDTKQFLYSSGSAMYEQTGGILYVRGRFKRTPASFANILDLFDFQASHSLDRARVANGVNASYASFNIESASNIFNMTGGTIIIYDAVTTGSANTYEVNSAAGNYNVTGGMVSYFPTTGTDLDDATSFTMYSVPPIGGFSLYRESGSTIVDLLSDLYVVNDFFIDAGRFRANGHDVTIGGDFSVDNRGTYQHGYNTTTFKGDLFQYIHNNTHMSLHNLVFDKPADRMVTFVGGSAIDVSGDITIISTTVDDGGTRISVEGNVYNSGVYTGRGVLNFKSEYPQTISGGGEFGNIEITNISTNPAPISLNSKITINGTLTYSVDKSIDIKNYELIFGENARIVGASTKGFIVSSGNAGDGGVTKIYSAANNSFTFPVGAPNDASVYTPVTIGFKLDPSTYGSVTVVPVASTQPNVSVPEASLSYYWRVKQTGFSDIPEGSVSHTFIYDQSDVNGNETNYVPALFNNNSLLWDTGTTSNIDTRSNTITDWTSSSSQLVGDFTAGDPSCFAEPTVFYSRQSGSWNSVNTWSTVSHTGAATTRVPGAGDIVIIGGRDSVYLVTNNNTPNQGAVTVATLMIEAGSVLDAGYNPGSVFTVVSNHRDGNGNGTFRVAAQYSSPGIFQFPSGDFTDFNQNMGTTELYSTNATSGTLYFLPADVDNYGNLILAPRGGSNIIFPNFDLLIYGNLIIRGQNADSWFCPTWGTTYGPLFGSQAAVAKTITVEGNVDVQGGSLVWIGNGNIAQDFVIGGDLIISDRSALYAVTSSSSSLGTGYTYRRATNQSITIGGSLINNARGGNISGVNTTIIADFSNIPLTFNGSNNAFITNTMGTGATVSTTFGKVTVDKGTDAMTTLTLNIAGTLTTPTNDWLTLRNGTFIYNRTNPSSHFTISTTTPFTIPSTAALEINYTSNNNRNVLIAHATRNDNDLYLNGRLIVRSGSLYVGQASAPNYNNDIVYSGSVGSYIEVTGGELIVNGQIRRDASTINGALTYVQTGGDVRINGNNQLATKAKLEVLNTGSVFNMSGGTLTIVNGGGTEYGDLYLRPASSNVTGGTILFGYNNNNARTYTLEANIPLYNVVIQGSNSTVNIMTSPLDINGDLTINAGDVLNANGKDVSIAGNLLNNGTYNFGNNKTTFDGNVQSITGTSTTNFNKLHVASLSSLTVDRSFNVADSLIINSTATLILGNNGVTLQGNMINDGAYSDNNVAGSGVIFNSTENQSVSGANGHFDRFEINKPSGILTAESDISILNDLVMTNGVFDIESNRLYLNQTSSIVENNPFGIGNMISVNGVSSSLGVRKYFGTGASTFTYPIGVSGKYTPVVFNISQNTSPGYINVIPVNSYQPSVDIPEQVLDYYWTIDNGGMTVDATANFYYSDEDVRGDEASYLAARVIPQTSVWYQSDDLNSVDETNNIIYFSFTNSTSNLNGDYTAGTDPAIYNFVPRYQTNSDGVWSDPTIWTPLDGSGPCPDGGPFGADVIIDHYVTITTDNIFANSVTINDTLRIDPSTSGHNFTQVIGDGALYLENGNMPAGDYSTFVDCSGNGTIIYGGSGSYQIVADLYNRIPNLVFYGTGTRIMPNVDLYICNRFIIDGPTVDNSVNNRDLYILGSMERYNTGAYVAGNGTVVFAGSQVQTLGGTTGNFSGSDKFYNLKVSNPNGLRIGDNGFIEVGNMLYLDEGIIYTSSTNQLYLSSVSPNAVYPEGGSTSSYVSGPLTKRIANGSSFLYPLGKGSDKSHAFVVTSAAGTSVVLDWTAEYFTPNTYLSPFISPIEGINMEEYWTLTASDAASATVYISYDNTSGLTPPMITGGIADMCVAEYVSGWRQLASTVTLESNMEEGEVQMTRTTTVSQTPKPFTTASVSATLPRAALRPAGGGNVVCGTEEGIPVSFSSSSIVIGFPITLTYMVDGVEHTDVITSAPLEWSIATPVPGSYWLTGFTYSGGLPGVVDGTVVTVYDNSSILANAGLDQEMCGGYQTVLDANIPPPGATGRWTIILGSGGQFIGSYGNADPHAAFKGLSGETYVLRWTVSNGFCSSYDDVQISFPVAPSQPGNFTAGAAVVCQNSTHVYAVPMVYGNTYNWSYSGQGVTFSGNTNSVVATFSSTATSGVISVTATNICGTSEYARTMAVTVNPMPSPTIIGEGAVCPGAIVEYQTTYNAGSTYQWSVNNGVVLSTNDEGNIVTVMWNTPSSLPAFGGLTITETTEAGCSISLTMISIIGDTEAPVLTGSLPVTMNDIDACYINSTTPPTGVPTFTSLLPEIEAAYTDACGGIVTATLVNTTVTGNNCGWQVTYTYRVADRYGNALENQTLQYSGYSQSLPVITGGTNRRVVSCFSDAQVAPHLLTPSVMPTVVDPCTGTEITYTSYTTPPQVLCEGEMEYVYTYTACSGYTVTWSFVYSVEVEDFSMPPSVVSYVSCYSDIVAPSPAIVRDNCGHRITPTGPVVTGTHTECSGNVIYTWTYTDCAGNSHDWSHTFIINDLIPPTFTAPADATVFFNDDCTYDVSVAVTGDVTDEDDNCSGIGEATYTDGPMISIGHGTYTITRTWSLSDCSNTTTHTQLITVIDNSAPVITNCPSDITVNTYSDVDFAIVTIVTPTVTDCSSTTITNSFNGTDNASGQYPVGTTNVIFTAVDAAGNTSTCSFNVTVIDNQSPVIDCVAEMVVFVDDGVDTYTHHGTTWDPPAIDNVGVASITYTVSGATTEVTGSNTTIDGQVFNEGVTTVTWTAMDDANNFATCVFTVTVIEHLSIEITHTDVTCFGMADGTASAVVTGGLAPYTYSWNTVPVTETATVENLRAGTYTVTVTDADGNVVTASVTISQPDPLNIASIDVENILCFGNASGVITINATGGTNPIMYSIDGGRTFRPDYRFTNLTPGTYYISLRDANGCSITDITPIIITQPSSGLSGTVVSQTNIACNGETNGSVTVLGSGGTAPYAYSIDNGENWDLSGTFNNLAVGNYTVVVRDANLCTYNVAVEITTPTELNYSITGLVNNLCNGASDGGFVITATGGVSPYRYSLNGGTQVANGTFNGLTAGTYTVTIVDANMCTRTVDVDITEPDPLVIDIVSQTNIVCDGSTGSVTIGVTGGTSPYRYRIDSQAFDSQYIFNNLTAGDHQVTVIDANNCEATRTVTIDQIPFLTGNIVSTSNVTCNGGNNGSITILGADGLAPYSYRVSTDGEGAFSMPFDAGENYVANNLTAGEYIVQIRDANNCIFTFTSTVEITEPTAIVASASVTSPIMFNGGTGTIEVVAEGGTGAYTFTLTGDDVYSSTTGVFENIPSGTYTWTVMDVNECTVSGTVLLPEPDELLASVSVSHDILCNGGTTDVTFIVAGGVAPYTYTFGTLPSDGTGVFENVPAGTYTWLVVDSNGNEVTDVLEINEPDLLEAVAAVSSPITVTGGTGTVTITVTGGTLPYNYTFGLYPSDGSGVFENVSAGRYPWAVIDGNGCEVRDTLVVTQPSSLEAEATVTSPIPCFGGTATVTITTLGGNSPYDYTFDGVTIQSDSVGVFTGITAGTYTWSVVDADGSALFDQTIEITQPEPLTASAEITRVIICGGENAEVTITASGGTGQYVYNFNGIINNTGVFEVPAGTGLMWSVTDASECAFDGGTIDITQPDAMVITIEKTDVLCNGASTGTATATVEGGSGSYSFLWSNGETTNSISNLTAGTYTVVVTDGTCSAEAQVEILQPDVIMISANVTKARCPESHDGAISLSITGGTAPYNIFWSDGMTSQNRTDLGVGTYSVVVSDVNGCSASLDIVIDATMTQDCLQIPTIFTPNGDGVNDEWIITNISAYPKAEIKIYTRWGKLVFHSKNLSEDPWDGRFNGRLMPVDSYHYILNLHDGSEEISGVITIIR